jgi:aminoglycoside phosphotransferase (APT) family kinase protein
VHLWWDRLVVPVFKNFESSFGPVLDAGMLRDAWDIVSTLEAMPLVCEHRDFSHWNIFVTPAGELHVLDWESSELQGLPVLDLLYFLTWLPLASHAGAWHPDLVRHCYRTLRDVSSPTGAVSQRCVSLYTSRTGVHPSNVRPLRLLAWMLHSRNEYEELVADVGGGTPDPQRLRQSLFLTLWDDELRHGR